MQALNARDDGYFPATDYANYVSKSDVDGKEDERRMDNTNPFSGPVSEDVIVMDEAGNAIKDKDSD
ncbi:MAG: hypothetical protein ACM3JI_05070 [Anaerolineae bacterium]